MSIDDILKLTGVQKVAVVLLSIPEENATKVLSMMTEEEIKEVSHAMSNLGSIKSEVVDKLMEQFSYDLSVGSAFLGDFAITKKLLEKALDQEHAEQILAEIRGPQGRNTWEKLTNVNEELLALYLKNEHPQTAALVLSKISSDHAAKVLSILPDRFAFDVISRMLNIGAVKNEVLDGLEKTLRQEFVSNTSRTRKRDSHHLIADIFNRLERNVETKYMSMLEENLPDVAVSIKNLMFTFEDLVKINPKSIPRLLRDIDKSRLTIALKGSSEELRNIFFSNMSQRAANIIIDELNALGPVRAREVDNARSEIVNLTKTLIENGEIEILLDDQDEFIV